MVLVDSGGQWTLLSPCLPAAIMLHCSTVWVNRKQEGKQWFNRKCYNNTWQIPPAPPPRHSSMVWKCKNLSPPVPPHWSQSLCSQSVNTGETEPSPAWSASQHQTRKINKNHLIDSPHTSMSVQIRWCNFCQQRESWIIAMELYSSTLIFSSLILYFRSLMKVSKGRHMHHIPSIPTSQYIVVVVGARPHPLQPSYWLVLTSYPALSLVATCRQYRWLTQLLLCFFFYWKTLLVCNHI